MINGENDDLAEIFSQQWTRLKPKQSSPRASNIFDNIKRVL